jgi:hypothetical protein
MEALHRRLHSGFCRLVLTAAISSAYLANPGTAEAQQPSSQQPPQQTYMYDPSAPDEQQPGIKYFGAAKDANGALLKDVTFQLVTPQSTFVFVTDAQGRFRGNLPEGMTPDKVSSKCFKTGFQMTRIDVRAGPKAPKQTVQVDCFLKAS